MADQPAPEEVDVTSPEVVAVRKALVDALPTELRTFAQDVALQLVRHAGAAISEDDLSELVSDRYMRRDELIAAAKETVLVPAADEPGSYVLRVPGHEDDVPSYEDGAPAPARAPRVTGLPRVRALDKGDEATREKIVQLDRHLWMNGWLLAHPSAYELFEPQLTALSAALGSDPAPADLTRRQFAYRVFGDEKFLDIQGEGHALAHALGLDGLWRPGRPAATDMAYFAPRRRKVMHLLVCENLDPYLDVRDLMYEEGRTSVLGQRVHAVAYGAGYPVFEADRLAQVVDALGAERVDVLYWGDIDRVGLTTMAKTREVLGGRCELHPFAPAYRLMVQVARTLHPDPADNEPTTQHDETVDLSPLLDCLDEDDAAYARAVIENGLLIPQEILTRQDL